MTDKLLTPNKLKPLLLKRIREAGSQLRLAEGDKVKQATISMVVHDRRPVTTPVILDILGLEPVYREKPKRRASSR